MIKLNPFDMVYLQNFEIYADLIVQPEDPTLLSVFFKVRDPLEEVHWAQAPLHLAGGLLEKKDELWKSTCFEMFLNPKGHNQYYEFNFDLEGAWNCYHFAGYRFPQPPFTTPDFEVIDFLVNHEKLEIQIKNKTAFRQFNVGLTSVIKNKKNQLTYFSLKHENSKPDFHVAATFTLQRG